MINGKTKLRSTQATKIFAVLLAFALIGANGGASAGFLDDLKNLLSGDDEKQLALRVHLAVAYTYSPTMGHWRGLSRRWTRLRFATGR